jgi:hypothetical protein
MKEKELYEPLRLDFIPTMAKDVICTSDNIDKEVGGGWDEGWGE